MVIERKVTSKRAYDTGVFVRIEISAHFVISRDGYQINVIRQLIMKTDNPGRCLQGITITTGVRIQLGIDLLGIWIGITKGGQTEIGTTPNTRTRSDPTSIALLQRSWIEQAPVIKALANVVPVTGLQSQ